MAIDSGFISNNGGGSQQIGQGLAYVLPESRTGQYAMQLAQEHTAQLREDALMRQKQQQLLQQQYMQDYKDQKLPELSGPAAALIAENFNKYKNDAATYHATTNRSPFNTPKYSEQFTNTVLLPAAQSKKLGEDVAKTAALIAADNEGYYTEDSKQVVLNAIEDVHKNPLKWLGKSLPQLVGTPIGPRQLFKEIKGVSKTSDDGTTSLTVPDTSAMMAQGYQIAQDPKYNNVKRQYGINPDIPDFAVYNKEGKRVWHANEKFASDQWDRMIADPQNPSTVEFFKALNISPTDPFAREKGMHAIQQQNAAWGKLVTDMGKYGNSIVDTKQNVTPDKFYEHYNYSLAHPKKTAVADDDGAEPVDLNIPYGIPSPTGAQPNVNVKGFIPISIPSKNLAGIAAYNLTDGTKNEVLAPSDNYSIVGIGNYPFIKKGAMNDPSLDQSIAQPDFIKQHPDKVEYKPMLHIKSKLTSDEGGGEVDHLIPDSRLPANIKNSKSVKQALQNFKPAGRETATQTRTAAATKAKPISMIRVSVNGQVGEIPESQLKKFMEIYPNAKKL